MRHLSNGKTLLTNCPLFYSSTILAIHSSQKWLIFYSSDQKLRSVKSHLITRLCYSVSMQDISRNRLCNVYIDIVKNKNKSRQRSLSICSVALNYAVPEVRKINIPYILPKAYQTRQSGRRVICKNFLTLFASASL